jgi:hypothetical protein
MAKPGLRSGSVLCRGWTPRRRCAFDAPYSNYLLDVALLRSTRCWSKSSWAVSERGCARCGAPMEFSLHHGRCTLSWAWMALSDGSTNATSILDWCRRRISMVHGQHPGSSTRCGHQRCQRDRVAWEVVKLRLRWKEVEPEPSDGVWSILSRSE